MAGGGRSPPYGVLPELKFRPSLSADSVRDDAAAAGTGVAGTKVPALIERPTPTPKPQAADVLPELKFRPSLSVLEAAAGPYAAA